MNYAALLCENCVSYNLSAKDVPSAVRELAECAKASGRLSDPNSVTEAVMARESVRNTCQSTGVAFPRASADGVRELTVCVGRLQKPVTCNCEKGHTVSVVVILFGPSPTGLYFMKAMCKIAEGLNNPKLRDRLLWSKGKDDLRESMRLLLN